MSERRRLLLVGWGAALVFLLACAIEGDACQGLCQQISTDADGRWKSPQWRELGGSSRLRSQGCPPLFTPLVPLNLLPWYLHLFFTHALCLALSLLQLTYLLQQCGWSGFWQSAGIDRWTELWTGWKDGWGKGGSLTQANTERQRGTTCLSMQPLTAPQQFSSQLAQCHWILSLSVCSECIWTVTECFTRGIWCPQTTDEHTHIFLVCINTLRTKDGRYQETCNMW